MRWLAGLFLAGLAACGGTQSGAATDPCPEVGAHLVSLAMQDNGTLERSPELDGAEREFVQQCRTTPWSDERTACLLAATDQEQTLTCPLD